MGEVLNYVEMTLTQIQVLDRQRTVFFLPVSPIEVHGPHLPLGMDVFVGQEVGRRVEAGLRDAHPELTLVDLPPLFCGSDALPVAGSLSVEAGGLAAVLYDYAKGLARQGFKYLVLLDNHGGPRHHLGISAAAAKAWRMHSFYVLCPFIEIYRRMVRDDPELLAMTGLSHGTCGDDEDNHAGTNETSLYLAMGRGKPGGYENIPASSLPPLNGLAGLVDGVGKAVCRLGATETGLDLRHLAKVLAWTGGKPFLPYMGSPAAASAGAGEAMMKAHVAITRRLLEEALAGRTVCQKPILSSLAFLRRLPE